MPSVIDNVRNTVMYVLNKDNNGYLTPDEFNTFARISQIDLLEDLLKDYNDSLTKRNARTRNSGIADIPKNIDEAISIFMKNASLTYSGGYFLSPSDMNSIITMEYSGRQIEKVSAHKASMLNASNYTAPTTYTPMYVSTESGYEVFPNTIISGVSAYYLRNPLVPNWTYYVDPINQAPLFDDSSADYQDFEFTPEFEPELAMRILKYAGINIRETELVNIVNNEELKDMQNNR
jgi:hypothetical protein